MQLTAEVKHHADGSITVEGECPNNVTVTITVNGLGIAVQRTGNGYSAVITTTGPIIVSTSAGKQVVIQMNVTQANSTELEFEILLRDVGETKYRLTLPNKSFISLNKSNANSRKFTLARNDMFKIEPLKPEAVA